MNAPLIQLHDQLLQYLRDGKFAEGIEDFYAEEVTAQENAGPITRGRVEMAKNERRFQKKLTKYHGIRVHARNIDDQGSGNGVVFYETTMSWEQFDRTGIVEVDQVVVERWKDGKITSIRFYGNYEPGPLPD